MDLRKPIIYQSCSSGNHKDINNVNNINVVHWIHVLLCLAVPCFRGIAYLKLRCHPMPVLQAGSPWTTPSLNRFHRFGGPQHGTAARMASCSSSETCQTETLPNKMFENVKKNRSTWFKVIQVCHDLFNLFEHTIQLFFSNYDHDSSYSVTWFQHWLACDFLVTNHISMKSTKSLSPERHLRDEFPRCRCTSDTLRQHWFIQEALRSSLSPQIPRWFIVLLILMKLTINGIFNSLSFSFLIEWVAIFYRNLILCHH